MANNWGIPKWLEDVIRDRDKKCVYCGKEFLSHKVSVKYSASWEHIINDASIITPENLALCCRGCNASKGQKRLSDWIESRYCKDRNISIKTVADVIKHALKQGL